MVVVNQCTFGGNLGMDPEKRYTADGRPVCNFRMAVGNRIKDRETGEWQDDTMWVRVTGFGPTAERAVDQLKKGSRVLVIGRLDTPNIFTRQDGTSAVGVSMVASTIIPLDRGAEVVGNEQSEEGEPKAPRAAAAPARSAPRPQQNAPAPRTRPPAEDSVELDDLPF